MADAKDESPYFAVPPTPTHSDGLATSTVVNGGKQAKRASATDATGGGVVRSPLESASLVSRILVNWIHPLITLGAKRVLETEDVWPVRQQDSCEALEARFWHFYEPNHETPYRISPIALAYLKTFRAEIALMLGNFALYIVAMALQAYFAQSVLDFLNDTPNVFHISSGYVLVALLAAGCAVAVLALNYGFFLSSHIGSNMRALTMSLIYKKALRLSSSARQQYTSGEILTLMSVDAERVFKSIMEGPWILVAPFGLVVCVVLIGLLFNAIAAVCGLVVIVLVLAVSLHQAGQIAKVQLTLLGTVDERVRVTSESLQGIRVMKLYAWEESLARRVEAIRAREVKLLRRFHVYQITNTVMLFLTPVFLSGVALGVFVLMTGSLTVTDSFTLIAVSNISRAVVSYFPLAIASLSQARSTFTRLDTFMTADEFVDSIADSSGSEKAVPGTITICNARFEWGSVSSNVPEVVVMPSEALDTAVTIAAPTFALQHVNVHIAPGSLVMVVGAVGAGKSSFLSALLGEMALVSGEADVRGSVSYVSQEAWIRNATVKDNILFQSEFDSGRYDQVLRASQLAIDLHALPDGDQTEIGERGINLSGGQKARVAIARAMYRRDYDLLLLDDPLSAVDPHVAHGIFEQCILGLAHDKTRLLVLNSHYDLLVHADKVLMVEDGRIVGDGTFADVVVQFPDLLQHTQGVKASSVSNENPEDNQRESSAVVIAESTGEANVNAGGGDSTLISKEDRIRGRVAGHTYKAYFDESGLNAMAALAVIVVGYAVAQGARILVDWWQGHWAANMLRPSYDGLAYGMWYLGFIVICTILTFARGLLVMDLCLRSAARLHDELFRRVLVAPVTTYFDVTPVGQILNRFSNDLDQLDATLPQQYQISFQNVAMCVGSLIVSTVASYWIALTYVPVLLAFAWIGQYFNKTSREVKRLEGVSRSKVYNVFAETLHGLPVLRAFRMQCAFAGIMTKAVDTNSALFFTYWASSRWMSVRLDALSVIVIAVVTLYIVGTKGELSPVIAGLSLTYSLMLTSVMQSTVRAIDRVDTAMTSVERLLHFRSIPSESDAPDTLPLAQDALPVASWPPCGAIQFDNLCMRYRPDLPLVLRGVSMDIAPGESIGICGRTGAGKSSLLVALFRICPFASGTIRIDGVDLQTMQLKDLRRTLAIIPQDPVIFSGSLRDNLDPFYLFSDAAIMAALRNAHLSEMVANGAGLNLQLAEGGENLSLGQRQLVCVARALLKDSRVVVLDEATASVDAATDVLLQQTMQQSFEGKTRLIIAHRLDTIRHCDRIAVMDSGRVVELDAPDALLAQPTSIFTELVGRAQRQE